MKKLLALITSILLIFSLSVNAFAIEITPDFINPNNDELDLSQYTVQDLAEMPAAELRELVADYERIYDPFGSYARRQAENIVDLTHTGNTVSPLWKSGEYQGDEYVARGHDIITAQACAVLVNDIGFFDNDAAGAVSATFCIMIASSLPDQDDTEDMNKGHFYDPDTETNHKGETNNTAKTNTVKHFQDAYAAAGDNDLLTMYEEIGRSLHYIQDANVPYHAMNIISANHGLFESFADQNLETYINDLTTLSSNNYSTLANEYVRDLVKIAASDAKNEYPPLQFTVWGSDAWHSAARFCTRKAVKYSTIIMYKLGQRSEVPFYYN